MEDSNPQETIAGLHIGFLDRCANRYTNLPYMSAAEKTELPFPLRQHFGAVAREGLQDGPDSNRRHRRGESPPL